MDRKKVFINDIDHAHVSALRKALIEAGFDVKIVEKSSDVLALLYDFQPDIVISAIDQPGMDGMHLLDEIRNRSSIKALPFILIGRLNSFEDRISILKLPIDDYLQKPLEVENALARIENLIKANEFVVISKNQNRNGFNGSLSEMNIIDLIQTLEVGKKTCIIRARANNKEGIIYVTEGQIIDANLADLEAKAALLRMCTWERGTFYVELRKHGRSRMLTISNRDLISEGMTRQHRWQQLVSQFPSLHSIVTLDNGSSTMNFDQEELAISNLLKSPISKSVLDVIEKCPGDDIRVLTVVKKMYDSGVITLESRSDKKHQNDDLEHLKKLSTNKNDDFGNAFHTMLNEPNGQLSNQNERRNRIERRLHNRRDGDGRRHKNRICLNRSELLMIQSKLAN